MTTKEDEQCFYHTIYILAFQKEAAFFYTNTSVAIIDYLTTHFWGDDLSNRANLLIKLLHFDSYATPQYAKALREKAGELSRYFSQ